MVKSKKAKQIANRIAYVEPNDIYGTSNGIPLTPNYEDFCIAFNLVAEKVSRFNSNEFTSTNDSAKLTISFGKDTKRNYSSFLKGDISDNNNRTFLSTYYTDITYEDIKGKNIVEGIGVENISISFESFYTPTIVIKFVDVRGTSLFGRDAAVHEKGKITSDTVFGCFFTQPYPKFKLQVKGFYGKAVTYQLTCSNFRGNFNSKTGNFEFTATFIGYNYALLTDIPISYLMAAPFCNYEGRKYWDEHVNTKEWQIDGKPMVSIHTYMNYIESHKLINDNATEFSEDENNQLRDIENEKKSIDEITRSYTNFLNSLKELASNSFIQSKNVENDKSETQLMLFFDKTSGKNSGENYIAISEDVYRNYTDLLNSVTTYNNTYTDNKIDIKTLPNGKSDSYSINEKLTLTKILDIKSDNNGNITEITVSSNECHEKTVPELKKIKFNGNIQLNEKTAYDFCNLLTTFPYSKVLKSYAYIYNLYDLYDFLQNRVSELNKKYRDLQDAINQRQAQVEIDALPFKPTVGNIFKMLMAHLETFIHIIYQCKLDIINSGNDRNASNLNINIKDTDVLSTNIVPPFPSVYTNGSSIEKSGDTENDKFVLGWIGDFSDKFIEEKVVNNLWKAIKRVIDSKASDDEIVQVERLFPVFPSDINNNYNPFSNTETLDISALGGYLAIRAAQIFGIFFNRNSELTDDFVAMIGRMDAYSYFSSIGTIDSLDIEVTDRTGGNNLSSILKSIALCETSADSYGLTYQNTGKTRHKFENDLNINKKYNNNERCPIFVQSSKYADSYEFCRYTDKDGASIVPSCIDDFYQYKHDIKYNYDKNINDTYFIPRTTKVNDKYVAKDFIYNTNLKSVIKNIDDDTDEEIDKSVLLNNFYNYDEFNIIQDKSQIDKVKTIYDNINTGNINISEYSGTDDLSKVTEKYWFLQESNYSKYFDGYSDMFTTTVDKYGFNQNNLFPERSTDMKSPKSLTDASWVKKDNLNCIKYGSDGVLLYTIPNTSSSENLSIENLRIHQIKIYYNGYKAPFSLFGHNFYYMQNNKKNGETEDEYNSRSVRSKALLFLHTLRYNYSNIPNFLNASKKNGGIEYIPHGYTLLLGALLWRNRYMSEHEGDDPIIYKEGYLSYKIPKDKTFFVYRDGSYYFSVIESNYPYLNYNVPVANIFGGNSNSEWLPDYPVQNVLIEAFETFCKNEFVTIMNSCELKNKAQKADKSFQISNFTGRTFSDNFVSFFVKRLYKDKFSISNMMSYYRNRIDNFFGNYRYCVLWNNTKTCISLMLNDNSNIQSTLRDLYYSKNIIIDSVGSRIYENIKNEKNVYVKKSVFDTYLNSFSEQLKKISESKLNNIPVNSTESDKVGKEKSIKIEIYYYLKNLYDKWIIQMSKPNYYSINNFFKQNFVFVDKFYRNIYNLLILNCDKFYNIITTRSTDLNASLFSVISDIVKEHECLFVSLADYTSFGNNDINKDVEVLEEVFRPISYVNMGEMRDENHFVVMYTGGNSSVAYDNDYYKSDGFDINTPDDIPSPFKTKSVIYNDSDIETRYGYNVPSFGVSFGRQNQSIFKDIKVTMDNPAMTEIAAINLENVSQLGSAHDHRVSFYGQDIFNIYKNYSYECEVEMMGNAQIQPLMYFQLLNVPMWHGAYMIKKVTHNITPGSMTTTFVGQKMSKYIQPFCDGYYIQNPVYDTIDPESKTDGSNSSGYETVNGLGIIEKYESPSKESVSNTIEESCKCNPNSAVFSIKGIGLDKNLQLLFNTLREEIKLLPENKEKETWNICIYSAVRGKGSKSEHDYNGKHSRNNGGVSPNAIDIQIVPIKDGKMKPRIKDYKKVFKVMDILATNHKDDVGQVIFEGKKTGGWIDGFYKRDYNCLHISSSGNKLSLSPSFILSDSSAGKNCANNKGNVSIYSKNVPIEYKHMAYKYYLIMNNKNEFRKTFPYYSMFSDEQLTEHFSDLRNSTYYTNNSKDITVRRNNPGNLEWLTGGDQWLGADESGRSWSPRFTVFKNMTYGLRALLVNMNTQIARGHNTISKLIYVWAPPHENNTEEYINNVAKQTGKDRDNYELVSIVKDKNTSIAIARAIAMIEGGITFTDDVVNTAYSMAVQHVK